MRTFNLAPAYRTAVGFDRMAKLLDAATALDSNQPSYPPYNIEAIDEHNYRIEMAVAGFKQSELEVEAEGNTLTLSGRKADVATERQFLHRGIATRNFERRFKLADYVEVKDALFEDGLLIVDLVREIPEQKKPRKVLIKGVSSAANS